MIGGFLTCQSFTFTDKSNFKFNGLLKSIRQADAIQVKIYFLASEDHNGN